MATIWKSVTLTVKTPVKYETLTSADELLFCFFLCSASSVCCKVLHSFILILYPQCYSVHQYLCSTPRFHSFIVVTCSYFFPINFICKTKAFTKCSRSGFLKSSSLRHTDGSEMTEKELTRLPSGKHVTFQWHSLRNWLDKNNQVIKI